MCVRDRLEGIKKADEKDGANNSAYVKANIIMAKKILKSLGIYKKLSSREGATEYGGFGGIGVENWILQNGGSFIQAISTFLETAKEHPTYQEDNGQFNDFVSNYMIYDFGGNHRIGHENTHDSFIKNLSVRGFEYAKAEFGKIQELVKATEVSRENETKENDEYTEEQENKNETNEDIRYIDDCMSAQDAKKTGINKNKIARVKRQFKSAMSRFSDRVAINAKYMATH